MTNFFDFQNAVSAAGQSVFAPMETDSYAEKVNMRDYGYQQSGAHRGDARALANLFRQIRNGRLIDENANEEQQRRNRDILNAQVLELEKEAEAVASEQRKILEVLIPNAEAEIKAYDEQILHVRKDEAAGLYKPGAIKRFTLWKLGLAVALLGVYLFCFYISAVYSGMIRNIATELEGNSEELQALFSNIFVPGAFSVFNLHWLAPILLLAFAVALDVLTETWKGLGRSIAVVGAVLITLALDALIAYKIEEKGQEVKVMMGLADPNHTWWRSADFYIVLIMGFVATIFWGLLLNAFKKELAKKDTHRVVALEIAHFNGLKRAAGKLISELRGRVADLNTQMSKLLLDIKSLKERQHNLLFSRAELEKSINDFYDGWLSYLNGLTDADRQKEACESVREQFYSDHIDKPGLIAS